MVSLDFPPFVSYYIIFMDKKYSRIFWVKAGSILFLILMGVLIRGRVIGYYEFFKNMIS